MIHKIINKYTVIKGFNKYSCMIGIHGDGWMMGSYIAYAFYIGPFYIGLKKKRYYDTKNK